MLSRQVLTRHLQNVTGAIAWTSEMSAVRPAPEQILVPVFQTSVLHVLERAHYFLAAQKRILQRKHPIQRGPGPRRDPPPSSWPRSHRTPSARSRGRDGEFFLQCGSRCCSVGFRLLPTHKVLNLITAVPFSWPSHPGPSGPVGPLWSRDEIRFFFFFSRKISQVRPDRSYFGLPPQRSGF